MTEWTPRTREQTALRLASPDWKMASGLHVALVMGQIALPGTNVAELEAALEAMTVHKSQGSQFRHVFIGPDLDHVPGPKNLTRHLWYTGFTRAQQAVHVIRDQEAS